MIATDRERHQRSSEDLDRRGFFTWSTRAGLVGLGWARLFRLLDWFVCLVEGKDCRGGCACRNDCGGRFAYVRLCTKL